MEPNTLKISLLIPILSLIFLYSISPSLSDAATEISPGPQPSTSDPPTESPSESTPFPEDNPFLENICKSTDYPNLCLDTVSPFLKGKTDIVSVVNASMNAGLEATKVAIVLADRLATMPGTSSSSVFSDCKNSFEDAKENFENAINGLPAGDIGLMNSMLSAVITDVSDCEDGTGNATPLAPHTEKIVNMTSNSLAIVSLIPEHLKYVTLG